MCAVKYYSLFGRVANFLIAFGQTALSYFYLNINEGKRGKIVAFFHFQFGSFARGKMQKIGNKTVW